MLTAERDALGHPLPLVADASRRSQELEAPLAAVGGHRALGEIRIREDHAAVRRRSREAAAGICKNTKKWRKILDYVAINYGGKHSSAIAATVLIASRQSPLPQSEQIIFD